ncbi:MAG: hypothetical protein QM813_01375 [Verrucomicrobiota bacterium]
MIELKADKLVVSFPELPEQPKVIIDFQRTLRIPDDGKDYPLPPGLGSFPLRHIDDYSRNVPQNWLDRGGVLLPMWQTEALWLSFSSLHLRDRGTEYPFAIKIATGKISAITGEPWQNGLSRNPQNYLVAPEQPWLDGYCVEKGVIRQFVAMPLGQGYSVEEQLTGKAEFGGIQIEVFPMRPEVFEKRFPKREIKHFSAGTVHFCSRLSLEETAPSMGLAPGGRMRQEIYEDPFSIHDWDTEHRSRCFIHLVNSATWQHLTGQRPPTQPPTAQQYTNAGYPWFDYYDKELQALNGSATLAAVKSVSETMTVKTGATLPHNEPVAVTNLVNLRTNLGKDQVRESELS